MGWRDIPANGTGSMAVETSIGSTNGRTTEQTRKNAPGNAVENISSDDIDGEVKCYSPWDECNLYYRLTKSGIYEEYTMEEYIGYISSLLKSLPRPYKPYRHFKRVTPTGYEVDGYKPSCPSLTDSSSISESSLSSAPNTRDSEDISLALRKQAKRTQNGSLDHVDLPMIYDLRSCLKIRGPRNEKIGQGKAVNLSILEPTGVDGPSESEVNVLAQPYGLEGSDLLDLESPTDTSSSEDEDEDETDPFEALRHVIRQAFSPNTQLADKVINYLDQLVPERGEQFYRSKAIPSRGNNDTQNSSGPAFRYNNSESRKRKRTSAVSPSGSTQSQIHDNDDGENQVLVDRRPPATSSPQKRFACGYNIFDRTRYGPRNPRTATRYKSCAGPGFKNLNHYKRHLERVHKIHQCPRCGHIFEALGELHGHLVQDQRCGILTFEQEGMSQETWDEVKQIFKRDRRGQTSSTDEERWFLSWEAMFPGKPRPPSAYYEEQHELVLYPVIFIHIQELFDASLNDLQLDPNLRNEITRRLGDAINRANQNIPSELDAIDSNSFLAPVQVPTLSNGIQNHPIGTDQTSYAEPDLPDPPALEPTHWDATDSGEPNHLGNGGSTETFGDMIDFGNFFNHTIGKHPLMADSARPDNPHYFGRRSRRLSIKAF
ncbi:hypothetical protein F4776DRAFT_640448 [Hypoxylon sp. NC0597]|nr:hypothetical protein F4776DRAFT_640448 [Hypoxylon sp. NC0597]